MHRREFIAGMISSLAGTAAVADAARSAIGARNVSFSVGSGSDAEAILQNWLDFFANGYAMSYFEDNSVVELGTTLFPATTGQSTISVVFNNLERISARNLFMGSRLVELHCPKLLEVHGSQHFQGSNYLEVVDFPSLTYIQDFNWWFFNCKKLKTVNLGNTTELRNALNTCFNGCIDLADVYVTNMLVSTLLSYSSGIMTPSTTGYYTPHQVVFHCADGNVVWSNDANNWVKIPV